jgi:hypothetical protein
MRATRRWCREITSSRRVSRNRRDVAGAVSADRNATGFRSGLWMALNPASASAERIPDSRRGAAQDALAALRAPSEEKSKATSGVDWTARSRQIASTRSVRSAVEYRSPWACRCRPCRHSRRRVSASRQRSANAAELSPTRMSRSEIQAETACATSPSRLKKISRGASCAATMARALGS